MGSESKATRLDQKAYWKERLNERMSLLVDRELASEKIAKDGGIRKIRAEIRRAEARLKVISDLESKGQEMARIKAEKMSDPKKEKDKKKEAEKGAATSKRQQKKKKKMEGKAKDS